MFVVFLVPGRRVYNLPLTVVYSILKSECAFHLLGRLASISQELHLLWRIGVSIAMQCTDMLLYHVQET